MKLEEMYPNYNDLSTEDQLQFISILRRQRTQDLSELDDNGKKPRKASSGGSGPKLLLSDEEKRILKTLNLTSKDIKLLKSMQIEEVKSNKEVEEE